MRKETFRVSLCGGEKCCPEVVVDADKTRVLIGEQGNLVALDKETWNMLVEKIKLGELPQL